MSTDDTYGKDDRSVEEIERDLAATREDLEETLDALGERLDVKSRVTDWSRSTAAKAQQQGKALMTERPREVRIAASAVAVAVVAAIVRRATRS